MEFENFFKKFANTNINKFRRILEKEGGLVEAHIGE